VKNHKKYLAVIVTLAGVITAYLFFSHKTGDQPAGTMVTANADQLIATDKPANVDTSRSESSGDKVTFAGPVSRFNGLQLQDAQALIDARKFDEAIELLQYQIDIFTKPIKRARAQLMLAKLLVGKGYLDEALELFRQAALSGALQPMEAFDAYLDVVRTLTKLGMMDEALAWIEKIQADFLADGTERQWFYPQDARLNLSRSLFNLGFFDIAAVQAAMISGPDSQKARQASLIEVRALIALGRLDEARAAIMKGIGEKGGEPYEEVSKLYHELVELNLQNGDVTAALEMATKGAEVFKGSDRYDDYMYFMASLLRKNGIAEWTQYATAAVEGGDGNRRADALEQLAASAARSGKWDDAEQYYQDLISLPGRTAIQVAGDYLRLMDTQVQQGNSAAPVVDSLMAFLEVTEITDTATLHRIGKGLLEAGYYSEAEAYFLRVATTSSDSGEIERAYLLMGDSRAAAGNAKGAGDAYDEVISRVAANGQYDMVAQTLYREAEKTGRLKYPDEKEALARAITDQTSKINDPAALLDLLDYFSARNETDLSRLMLSQAAEKVLNDIASSVDVSWKTQARLLTSLYAFQQNDKTAALIHSIIQPTGASHPPVGLVQDARFYDALMTLNRGDKESFLGKADQLLAEASLQKINSSEYALSFGESLFFKGDTERSLEYFNKSVASSPGSTHAMQSRIYLGAEALKAGDTRTAQQYADAIIQNMSPSDPISLNRAIYWGGVYLDCLVEETPNDSCFTKNDERQIGAKWLPLMEINKRKL